MNISILGYVLIAFTILVIIKLYQESDMLNLKCVVRERKMTSLCTKTDETHKNANAKLFNVHLNGRGNLG